MRNIILVFFSCTVCRILVTEQYWLHKIISVIFPSLVLYKRLDKTGVNFYFYVSLYSSVIPSGFLFQDILNYRFALFDGYRTILIVYFIFIEFR